MGDSPEENGAYNFFIRVAKDEVLAYCKQNNLVPAIKRYDMRAFATPFDEEKVYQPGQKYKTWSKTNYRNRFLGFVNICQG